MDDTNNGRMNMEGSKSSVGFGSKTIIDPVCGMDVALGKAPFVVHYQGTGYYFCAEACRHTFERPGGAFRLKNIFLWMLFVGSKLCRKQDVVCAYFLGLYF
jgi:YHS domain-containing protein